MRYHVAMLPLLFCLLGCGQASPIYRATEVDVPVDSPCRFDIPVQPDYQLPKLPAAATLTDKVKAMIADLQARKDYIAKLLAAMEACNDSSHLAPSPSGAPPVAPPSHHSIFG